MRMPPKMLQATALRTQSDTEIEANGTQPRSDGQAPTFDQLPYIIVRQHDCN